MSSGTVRISDIVVPAIFTPQVQQITEEKCNLVKSGAVVRDPVLDSFLQGSGLTNNAPSFKDLDSDADNVSSDDPTVKSTPFKIGTATEIQVRLSRNNSWSSMDLANTLSANGDPLSAIANRVGYYWARRRQAAFIATMKGVFADNAAAPTGSEHVQNDMTIDIKGASFAANTTDFHASPFIDACTTMGDSMEDLTLVLMHSIVYAKALKNNLITFLSDSTNPYAEKIPSYLGRQVIVDDSLPSPSTGVYETWLFGQGAVRLGVAAPPNATETFRDPSSGNGSGQETLWNRNEWVIHPAGLAYVGTAANGGPDNTATSNNLANAGSWKRVWAERKQIKIARLITREF